MIGRAALLAAVTLALLTTLDACGRRQLKQVSYHFTNQPEVRVLTNLHPDASRKILYSVNYQRDGLIPLCTPVRITSVTEREMTFQVLSTGETYRYIFHKSMTQPIAEHLDQYFGPECDESVINAMSEADQKGIRAGEVRMGMSKDGVILAIGFPPAQITPSLEADEWMYWRSRFDKMKVTFEDGLVVDVKN